MKILFNQMAEGGGGAAVATPPAGEPVFLPQTPAGPLDADYQPKATVQSGWQPEHPFEQPPVAPENPPPVDEQPTPEQPVTPPPSTEPRILTQNEHITAQITPDGKTIQFIETRTGRINTTVAATVENMAMVLANDKSWQISQSMQQREQPQNGNAAPPPPPDVTQSEYYQAALEAAREYFPQTDSNGNPYDLDPLAKALAKFGEKLEGRQQQVTQAQQAFQAELNWVRSVEPTFDFNHPFVKGLIQQNPNLTPREVYKEAVFWSTMAERAKTGSDPAPTTNGHQPAPAAPEPRLQVPPEIYGRPGGSAPASTVDARYASHPEVIAARDNHAKYMKMAGQTATPESTRQAEADAIQIVRDRELRRAQGYK